MSMVKKIKKVHTKIAVVGLGYVGLPIAVAFGRYSPVIGFDINKAKIEELRKGIDRTGEVSKQDLKKGRVHYTSEPTDLKAADFIIVAVPTPINEALQPDLTALQKASELIGANLSSDSIVVYESTVYPGATEEVCLPILEKASGLKCGADFSSFIFAGTHQPGDKEHTLKKIVKVVSAQDDESLEIVAQTYALVVKAGHPSRIQHQSCGGGKGDRKYPARPQYRTNERIGAHLSSLGRRHEIRLGSGRDKMEFLEI